MHAVEVIFRSDALLVLLYFRAVVCDICHAHYHIMFHESGHNTRLLRYAHI
jgi:hypothetical protein